MKQRLHQQGFSPILIVVTIAVIAAVGFGVWRISSKDRADKAPKVSDSQTKAERPSSSDSESVADPSKGGEYLVIKEWGVRLLLPDKLRGDAYYDAPTQTAASSSLVTIESVSLRSKTLDRVTAGCDRENIYLQTLTRSKDKLSPNEYEYLQADLNFIQLGGYWYTSVEPGNQSSKTQKCRDPNQVSEKKDGFWISVGGAQAIYDSIHTLEETPKQ